MIQHARLFVKSKKLLSIQAQRGGNKSVIENQWIREKTLHNAFFYSITNFLLIRESGGWGIKWYSSFVGNLED